MTNLWIYISVDYKQIYRNCTSMWRPTIRLLFTAAVLHSVTICTIKAGYGRIQTWLEKDKWRKMKTRKDFILL
jgi:hypothetical protein